MREVRYIYEDNDIIVCHKPAGMATEGARVGNMDLVSNVRNYLARKNRGSGQKGGSKPPYVATVHRLDQPVEGVVVLAKTKTAATSLAAQIKNRTTDKYYYALSYGAAPDSSGHLSDNMARREIGGNALVLSDIEKESLQDRSVTLESGEKCRILEGGISRAELDYEVIAADKTEEEEITLFNIKLMTGRYHQIRAQLSHLGVPILGDAKYGSDASKAYSEAHGIKNICLVCYKFVFDHPVTGKRVEFTVTPHNENINRLR